MRVLLSAVKLVVDSVPLCVDMTLLIPLSGVLISLCFPTRTIFSPAVLKALGVLSPPRYSDLTMSEPFTPNNAFFLLFLLGIGGFSDSLYCWKCVTILIFLFCYNSANDGLTATSFNRLSSSGVKFGILTLLLWVGFCCVIDGKVQFARVFFISLCSSWSSSCLGTTTRGCWR
jgi:hypothetical protein